MTAPQAASSPSKPAATLQPRVQQQHSAIPRAPLLSEIGNRISGSTGSAVDAYTKLKQRLDDILGAEPPRQPTQGNGQVPAPSQASTLIMQLEALQSAIGDIHNQLDRLGAL
jgi:hypothetical protein